MSQLEPKLDKRRRALIGATASSAMLIAPGLFLLAPASAAQKTRPSDGLRRLGLLIDTNKCRADCTACITACNQEHGLNTIHGPRTDAQWIRKVNLTHQQTKREISLPLMCQHCSQPACADVCPTGASFRRADGVVLVDKHICIGCRYCMMACPYKARSFVHEPLENQRPYSPRGKGTVEGCTLCIHRVDNGQLPACVAACSADGHGAMLFGDLNDQQSTIAQRLQSVNSRQLRADLGLIPGVHYIGL